MSVFTFDNNSGKRVWYCPKYPIHMVHAVYKGPREGAFERLIDSVAAEGVKNPLLAITTDDEIRVTTGKQRVEVCRLTRTSHAPIVVWDTGKILPNRYGEWIEIMSQQGGQELFDSNYNFSMTQDGFTKDLEEEYKD